MGIERLVGGLEPGGLIHRVAHHGILKLLVRSHVAGGNLSGVDSHSGIDITSVFGF